MNFWAAALCRRCGRGGGWAALIALSGDKQRAPACHRGSGTFSFLISHPCCPWMLLHPSCSHPQSVQPTAFPVLCSFLPSARGELSFSRAELQPLPTSRSWEKAPNCTLDTAWSCPSMPGTGTPQEAAAVSLSLLPACSQAFYGGTEGDACAAGPGCTADPPSSVPAQLLSATHHTSREKQEETIPWQSWADSNQSHRSKCQFWVPGVVKHHFFLQCQCNEGCGFGDFYCCVSANSSLL